MVTRSPRSPPPDDEREEDRGRSERVMVTQPPWYIIALLASLAGGGGSSVLGTLTGNQPIGAAAYTAQMAKADFAERDARLDRAERCSQGVTDDIEKLRQRVGAIDASLWVHLEEFKRHDTAPAPAAGKR